MRVQHSDLASSSLLWRIGESAIGMCEIMEKRAAHVRSAARIALPEGEIAEDMTLSRF